MSVHPLQIQPASMFMDGKEWVERSWANALADKLREKQRTNASHRQQFAEIRDLWENLPHRHANAPYAQSAEAFRKHGLIATGYCDTESIVFDTPEQAQAAAPAIARLARRDNGYAIVRAKGPIVVCSTPHSQSYKAMGKERFQESKQAVLDWGHSILGVTA